MKQIAILKNNCLVFNKWSYFLASAENLKLGSYGSKMTPLLKPNYLLKHYDLDLSAAKIDCVKKIDLDLSSMSKGDFKVGADAKVADGNLGVTFENFKDGKLVLMKLSVSLGEIRDCINASNPQAIKAIQELVSIKNPRIVNQIFVIISADFASKMTLSTGIKIKSNVKGIDIELEAEHSGKRSSKISISEGTVFAYGMLAPVFGKPKAQATQIETFTPDQFGNG